MDTNNIGIVQINRGGHSDGYDKDGKFCAIWHYSAKLYVSTGNDLPYNLPEFIIPLRFGVRESRNTLEYVGFEDIKYSPTTLVKNKKSETAESFMAKHHIEYDELRKQAIKKLSASYKLCSRLEKDIRELV